MDEEARLDLIAEKLCEIAICRFALTDSGGVQEETSYLGINTERPVTVTLGTNRLVKVDTVADDVARVLSAPERTACTIPLWDGKTAGRAIASLRRRAMAP